MKLKNIINTAGYNFSCKISYYLTIIIYLTFIIALGAVTLIVRSSITNYYDNKIYGDVSASRLSFNMTANQIPEQNDIYNKISEIQYLDVPVIDGVLDVPVSSKNYDDRYINLNRVTLQTEDVSYSGIDDHSNLFTGNTAQHVELGVRYVYEGTSVFSTAEEKMFEYFFPDSKLILIGKPSKDNKEIMISDYILSKFGIKDYEKLLGKRITILIDGKPYLSDYLFTGVVNSDYYTIKSEKDMLNESSRFLAQVIITGNSPDYCKLGGKMWNAMFYAEDYSYLPAIKEQVQDKGLRDKLNFSETFVDTYHFLNNIRDLSGYILNLLFLFVLVALSILILNVSADSMRKQMNYQGMLRALGMKRRDLFVITIIENIISQFLAFIFAGCISFSFLIIINLAFSQLLGNGIDVSMEQFLCSYFTIFCSIAIEYTIMISILFFFNHVKDICAVLK